ncbi:malonic semialdehyde reductase [Marilutibacter chinensis]|uniref:Putative NADH dehydrogenase/NAD(P)H nitroreductase L3V18_15940 n=1 Tax=Marilutibacter chinensis TaxID=2912247 RepID=A0ABS9HX14_9GAMM|nr:malonic semialdehyde reductase [Lysobacter chinensis]MCF7223268.1 malonic semialdehyde reductase [Lysobacter chinensis]
MSRTLPDAALDQLFRTARTHNELGGEVSDETLRQLYELAKWGPTSANMSPLRLVFVKSKEAKAKLGPALDEGNYAKTMAAPVTAIVAFDEDFHDKLPYLFPHTDAKSWFEGPRENRHVAAFRNGSLQGAYVLLAARALGLDCGPMSGFDNAKVDAAFFAGTAIRSNFLINLGHGDPGKLFPRSPRLSFDEVAQIL